MDWLTAEQQARRQRRAAMLLPALGPKPYVMLDEPNDLDWAMRATHELQQAILPPLMWRGRRYATSYTFGLGLMVLIIHALNKLLSRCFRWLWAHVFVTSFVLSLVPAPERPQLAPAAALTDVQDTAPPDWAVNPRAHPPVGPPALRAARGRLIVMP